MVANTLTCDLAVIGSGIVGTATALQILKTYPNLAAVLIDKEPGCGRHQTGHNSGVVHAGVYYSPGSLKADFCRRGAELTRQFCEEHQLPFVRCGKLLVATDKLEYQRMHDLEIRCGKNDITVQRISEQELRKLEPNIRGVGALLVPATAITDYPAITARLAAEFAKRGGRILYNSEVAAIQEDQHTVCLEAGSQRIETASLVVCGGLMADRLARMMQIELDFRIIPFRGEYFRLDSRHNDIVDHLIYPIPDPDLPFLGVHLTRMIDGSITVGPNAVLGWKREGYGRTNFSLQDVREMIWFPGFWKVLGDNLKTGLGEMIDSCYRPGYLKRVHKYCPSIGLSDLKPYPAGIRAQAVMADGSLVHDFLFSETERSLHVCNAPSPAATSALPIGEYLCAKAADKFNL